MWLNRHAIYFLLLDECPMVKRNDHHTVVEEASKGSTEGAVHLITDHLPKMVDHHLRVLVETELVLQTEVTGHGAMEPGR
jgi:uncharacterized protein (DUF2249 family)